MKTKLLCYLFIAACWIAGAAKLCDAPLEARPIAHKVPAPTIIQKVEGACFKYMSSQVARNLPLPAEKDVLGVEANLMGETMKLAQMTGAKKKVKRNWQSRAFCYSSNIWKKCLSF